MKIKICGITNLADARDSIEAGADFLGFVFYEKSPRYISPAKAKRIIASLKSHVIKVGVFVNEDPLKVLETVKNCGLDAVQFHGDEPPAYLKKFKNKRVMIIKAFRIRSRLPLMKIKAYPADLFLFDAFKKGIFGGTGSSFNWKTCAALKTIKKPCIISGGLDSDNVADLLKVCKPYALDVSSGLEKRPGKKDKKKIVDFMSRIKEAKK